MNILSVAIHFGLSKPAHGGQNRYSHLTRELVKHGNQVIVLEPREFFDANDRKLVTVYTHPNYRAFGRGWNLFKDMDIWFINELMKILRSERVDLIAIEYPGGALAVKAAVTLTNVKAPLIYSPQNVESDFAREVIGKVVRFSAFERRIIVPYVTALERLTVKRLADHIICVSDEDKDFFCSEYGIDEKKVTVIPSGSELDPTLDQHAKQRLRVGLGFDTDSVIVVFHGSYGHPPNKDAIDNITDYIAPVLEPDESIVFALYGAGVPKFERTNVKSFGFVKDLHQALSVADIALVPITSGGGSKLKVFDYMNAGLPIITTRKGVQGIPVEDGKHVMIVENTGPEIVDAIKYLVRNRQERDRLGLNARRLVESEYNWDMIGNKLDDTYRRLGGNKLTDIHESRYE
jgi:glycosyltransferase involved in cell wall biosynthesis